MFVPEIKVFPDAKGVTEEAARRLIAAAEEKLADNQHYFSLVLSGGNTPKASMNCWLRSRIGRS